MRSIEQQLSRIDLNLIISLSVLIKERNILRAAEKLYLSQPAMSRCLQKLRLIFNDPLFHRASAELHPTEKALELARQLDPLLNHIHQFINTEEFDPSLCDSRFAISIPSLMSNTLMLPFIDKISQLAPNLIIEQHSVTSDPEKDLENSKFDFSFDIKKTKGNNFTSIACGETYPVIYARKNHPLTLLNSVSIENCLDYKFLDLIVDDHANSYVDNPGKKYFDDNNITLDIAFRSGQLGLLTAMMQQSDYLLISHHFLLNTPNIMEELEVVYQFNSTKYHKQTYLSDHQRSHTSSAHQWLKAKLIESFTDSISGHKKNA